MPPQANRKKRTIPSKSAATAPRRRARADAERAATLATFPNPRPGREYVVTHVQPEFTSVCPITGQPDFSTVTVEYVPDRVCVELKSLKLYFQSYRNEGIFYEDVTNRMLDDLVGVLAPHWLRITTAWTPRGGLHSTVVAEHGHRA